ncbi:BREX-1 system adenine-specific DNA-methyltransferase PglX [Butyrivibrio sp. FCS006]|uniref:BREX-1 system adenine-specific DNA-methyltransferase PglX n=1 Tax=Butyrivibrio sp. FCS006 TaxID=1280684 RepID=UPI0004227523|nr:BREX-1 system adenine-specific DNA-methyltransferase PglX [Butyrivibrio sp. FCS006]
MNKNAIKKFAMAARTRLIATVSDKAGELGITKDGISEPSSKGVGFEVYRTPAGTEIMLQGNQIEQRRRLVWQIKARGLEAVVEEIAYTWFNRICAIRFMEVNDYLPTRVRVLSSLQQGKNEPDLLTEAPNVDLDFTDSEREFILQAKIDNRLDELFSKLFIKQCNKLSEILPELFEATEDYTEMLLSLSYTNEDDVVRMLVDGVDEADFNVATPDENGNPTGQVEIIGWLYQYYNTELKDDTFAKLKKNVKISKERIPAATQLFTPDWIVRYMVENSVGRIWIEHLRAGNAEIDEKAVAENFGWKYYLPEATQELEVTTRLVEIRKSYADIKPEDILCIDPCMGSGHIIVAMFDVLMDIYRSVGYGEREASFEIVEHNLHGIDIDRRAYQLAYFAVMMKGRQYNRRFFRGKNDECPRPHIFCFLDSNEVNRSQLKYFGGDFSELEKNNAITQLNGLLDSFVDAREYGSLLIIDNYDWELLNRFVAKTNEEGQISLDSVGLDQAQYTIKEIVKIAEVLTQKYYSVVTNPPYMGSSGMDSLLASYVKDNFQDSRSDLFGAFIEKCQDMTRKDAFSAMITQHAWMFLANFERLRKKIYLNNIVSMVHLGSRAFDEIGGEVVQTTAFIRRKSFDAAYKGTYIRLVDFPGEIIKRDKYLSVLLGRDNDCCYLSSVERYEKLPGMPTAYWASDRLSDSFRNKRLGELAQPKVGLQTGDNARFLRLWFEVDITTEELSAGSVNDAKSSHKKWFPYNKGGEFRKWYGNYDYVVNWLNDGYEIKNFKDSKGKLRSRPQNIEYYFRPAITWSFVSTVTFGVRYSPKYSIFDVAGSSVFPEQDYYYYLTGFMCSKVCNELLQIQNPTMNYQAGNIANLPVIIDKKEIIDELVKKCIEISKEDWDSFETSWDYKCHPLIRGNRISEAYHEWEKICDERYSQLKNYEEEINKLFIQIYGLDEEISAETSNITIRKADLERDIRSLISYAVGCMFGRYSLDDEGLIFAGGDFDIRKYTSFKPDEDGIIPINDEEYFNDDVVGLLCSWLKQVYGVETLEENLDYIAKALGDKGSTSRDTIRNYFLCEFFKDHCSMYSVGGSGKRPIYWMFDSGKENGFKAIIYMHRYNQDIVAKVRAEYLHKTQKAIEQSLASAQYVLENSGSSTERSKATKNISKYTKQLAEIQVYDDAIAHVANQRIAINLDDGVKDNYVKFQGVEVAKEGMKTIKVDLLAKIG